MAEDSLMNIIANTDVTYHYKDKDGKPIPLPSYAEMKQATMEREAKCPYVVPGCDQCIYEDRCPRPSPYTNNPQRAEEAYPDDEIFQIMTAHGKQHSGLYVCKECVRRCFPKHGWCRSDD